MCFAPQRRALFRHRNFQKWSENGVFCTFWLGNVLCATTACTFSTSQLPKVVRTWCVLYILTWKCVSRHNGVHFFISHLASWLRTRRFSEPTFRPSGASNHWKNTVFRDFPTFSRICIFFLLTLSLLLFFLLIFLFSLPLPCSAFHLSILSEVWLLNFLRWVSWYLQIRPYKHFHKLLCQSLHPVQLSMNIYAYRILYRHIHTLYVCCRAPFFSILSLHRDNFTPWTAEAARLGWLWEDLGSRGDCHRRWTVQTWPAAIGAWPLAAVWRCVDASSTILHTHIYIYILII